jgi:hypothetical protein
LSDTFVVLGTVVLIGSNTGSEALFWLRAAAKFGPVLVPPLCAWILVAYGWRKIFFIFAVPGIVLSVIWYVLVKNRPSESPYCSAAELRYIESGAQAIHPCMVGQACTSQESETTGNQRGHFSFLGYLGIIARLFLHDRYYERALGLDSYLFGDRKEIYGHESRDSSRSAMDGCDCRQYSGRVVFRQNHQQAAQTQYDVHRVYFHFHDLFADLFAE